MLIQITSSCFPSIINMELSFLLLFTFLSAICVKLWKLRSQISVGKIYPSLSFTNNTINLFTNGEYPLD